MLDATGQLLVLGDHDLLRYNVKHCITKETVNELSSVR